MTRLITEWLSVSDHEMADYGARVRALTGMDVFELALKAAAAMRGPTNAPAIRAADLRGLRAAVVRSSSGEGVIKGFAESVAALLAYLGIRSRISAQTDVAGFYEACTAGDDLVFLADDNCFIAYHLKTGRVCENDRATAWGYSAALDAMAGGLSGKEVLLLGAGKVGSFALAALTSFGAEVFVYDKNAEKSRAVAEMAPLSAHVASAAAFRDYKYIFDATNEGGWLHPTDLHPQAVLSAPGIPPSLDMGTAWVHNHDIFSDPLQTGTAVMLAGALT